MSAPTTNALPEITDPAIAQARLAELEPHLHRLADPAVARRIAETVAERTIDSIVEQFEIRYPAPEAKGIPAWAENVGEPRWEWGEDQWSRTLRRAYRFPGEGGGVEVRADHISTQTSQHVERLEFYIDLDVIDTPEEARQVGLWLLEAADAVEGPKSADTSRNPRPLGTQLAVAEAIRAHMRELGLRQNEFAVAAGYGPDELSSLMTGRRPMDLNDVERIAHALHVDPFDLVAEAGLERD